MFSTASPMLVSEDDYAGGPALFAGGGHEDALSVRRIRIDTAAPDVAATWGEQPGYVARLFLSATPPCTLYRSGEATLVPPRRVSETSLREVGAGFAWPILYPIDVVKFELPDAALSQWAQDNSRVRRCSIDVGSISGVTDATFLAFGHAALHSLTNPAATSQFFVDHLLAGVCAYIFGRSDNPITGVQSGGLAPWQTRRAKEMIESRLRSDLTLEELARECGLSVAHFTRAFRRSVGESPHQWLMRQRTERARWLMIHTDRRLAEIAFDCGFFDQSHFTNVFRRSTGISPGAFRREQRRFEQ